METFVLWLGFIGAWLLFAGPIYQAALELQEQDIEFDRIREIGSRVERPDEVSIWWWLIPPVKILLEYLHSHEYQKRYITALSAEDTESLVSFRSKATSWLYVAGGGLCIAIKETYELTEHQEWNNCVLALIVIGMFALSIISLIARLRYAKDIIKNSNSNG